MRPSEQLIGLTLTNGWKVLKCVKRHPKATGGNFSTGYIVEAPDGRRGFLKAMDYTHALSQYNTAEAMKSMVEAYLFEKKMCLKCHDHKMSRIVHAIDEGSIPADPSDLAGKVEYLIFELAEGGDIRSHLYVQQALDHSFILRTLHNAATGLRQLHIAQMAHQDLKPSNILVFSAAEGSKISDLGRAWAADTPAPHDHMDIPGDRGYAPPEQSYGANGLNGQTTRFASDLFHLGSLVVFLFTGAHMNALIVPHLADEHRPYKWRGSFEEVLPYVYDACARAVSDFSQQVPVHFRPRLERIVGELCAPDPRRRGHPKDRLTNQYSLQRYISELDLLTRQAEHQLHTVRKGLG